MCVKKEYQSFVYSGCGPVTKAKAVQQPNRANVMATRSGGATVKKQRLMCAQQCPKQNAFAGLAFLLTWSLMSTDKEMMSELWVWGFLQLANKLYGDQCVA